MGRAASFLPGILEASARFDTVEQPLARGVAEESRIVFSFWFLRWGVEFLSFKEDLVLKLSSRWPLCLLGLGAHRLVEASVPLCSDPSWLCNVPGEVLGLVFSGSFLKLLLESWMEECVSL